jgi:hypothetical protein
VHDKPHINDGAAPSPRARTLLPKRLPTRNGGQAGRSSFLLIAHEKKVVTHICKFCTLRLSTCAFAAGPGLEETTKVEQESVLGCVR